MDQIWIYSLKIFQHEFEINWLLKTNGTNLEIDRLNGAQIKGKTISCKLRNLSFCMFTLFGLFLFLWEKTRDMYKSLFDIVMCVDSCNLNDTICDVNLSKLKVVAIAVD